MTPARWWRMQWKPTAVYVYRNLRWYPIYAGKSNDPELRLAQHNAQQPWAHEIAVTEVHWYPCRPIASVMEVIYIKRFKPLYNVKWNKR